MTLTKDYTYQFGDAGVILNDSATPTAPFVDIESIAGLDTSDFRISERVREGSDGGFIDSQFEDMRTITLNGTIYCPAALAETFSDSLKANFAPTFASSPFYFYHPTVGQRVVFAKSLGCRYNIDQLRRVGQTAVQFLLKAEDPSIYSDVTIVTGGLAAASSGRGYPRSYNYGYGGTAGSAGAATVNNIGNKPARAIIRLQNVVNPEVVCDSVNKRLKFVITVNSPDYLDIDLYNRTVILNGTANRRGTVQGTSQWFLLQPGINLLRLLGSAGTGTPTMTVTFRPAYR